MNRTFLATTAIAALLANGAFAQTAPAADVNQTQAGQTQPGQAQQQIRVMHGDTLIIERGQSLRAVNLQFQLDELGQQAATATEGTGQQAGEQQQTMAAPQDGDAAATGAPAVDEGQMAQTESDDLTGVDGQQTAASDQQTGDGMAQQGADRQDLAATAGQAGEHIVTDGSVIFVEGSSQDMQLNIRFRDTQGAEMAAQEDVGLDPTTTAAVTRDQMDTVQAQQLRAESLIGSDVYGVNDETIGSVGDVILSLEGEVDAIVVDVGGFLGIGTREVAIGMDNLEIRADRNDATSWHVFSPFTQEQLENQPEYDEASYAEQRDQQRLTAQ